MINFGVGQLTLNPGGANPTPVQLAILQDVDFDMSFTEKELYGSNQLPVDVAKGEAKFTLKAKEAQISSLLIGSFLAGSTSAANYTSSAINEVGTISAGSVTVANSATFGADCGVVNVTTGLVMTRVSSGPAVGQYSVSAGIYTFNTGDNASTVWISYTYTVSGSGKTVTYNNQLMGSGVSYTCTLFNIFRTKVIGLKFFAVTVPKLQLPFKNNEYTIAGLDLGIYADGSGRVLEFYESDF